MDYYIEYIFSCRLRCHEIWEGFDGIFVMKRHELCIDGVGFTEN